VLYLEVPLPRRVLKPFASKVYPKLQIASAAGQNEQKVVVLAGPCHRSCCGHILDYDDNRVTRGLA
jgi:hypothetical protein